MGLSKTVVRSDTRWAALVLNDLGCFFSSCSCSCFFPIFCYLLSLLFLFFFLGLFVDNDDDDDEIPTMILAYDACRISRIQEISSRVGGGLEAKMDFLSNPFLFFFFFFFFASAFAFAIV